MRRRLLVSLFAAGVVLAGSVSRAGPVAADRPSRGAVVSVTPLVALSAARVSQVLAGAGFDTTGVRYGVEAYRLVYQTIDEHRRPTTASGFVGIPRNGQRRLRVVSYAHGTMAGASEAPSVGDGGRSAEGLTFASAGYAAVLPDYLGLGVGPGPHPYLQVASETTASVDMLRAAWAFAGARHLDLDPRVLVTGFSQGGQAALALGQALQAGAEPRLRLAAVAPISGPYQLRTAELPAIFAGRLDPADLAYYLGYWLTSWNRSYHLYGQTTDAFRPPYDRTVAPLYDGQHTDDTIFAALPPSYTDLLQPAMLDQLRHPAGRLAAALAANDRTCAWSPRAPVQIFAAHADQDVAFTNATQCRATLAAHGSHVPLTDLGDLPHLDSGRHGLTAALRWFTALTPTG